MLRETPSFKFLAAFMAAFACTPGLAQDVEKEIRVGIIGLDTSHAIAFAKTMNAADKQASFDECQVTCAYPHGSADIQSSVSRIPGYTKEIQELGVEIVDSIDELIDRVDAVMLETNDGRLHLEQVIPVLKARKPVFIDKPMAGDLVDVLAIFEEAKKYRTPVFSSSSLRFVKAAQAARRGELVGQVFGCDTFSPCTLEPTHPDLYWYGIHGVEQLFTVMGPGCQTVSRTQTDGVDVVVGKWTEGRIGTFRGIRDGNRNYGGTVFGEKGQQSSGGNEGYDGLVIEIANFFQTGNPPVTADETIEIYAFMSAADESKLAGGEPVTMSAVLESAMRRVAGRLEPFQLNRE